MVMPIINLSSGTLAFNVVDTKGNKIWEAELDAFELRLLCEELERKHQLETKDGKLVASRNFLREVADELKQMGVVDCTVSLAYQLWCASSAEVNRVKKNMSGTPPSVTGSESIPVTGQSEEK